MKTTKEQIIADITAKVEAKLASHKVELSVKDDAKELVSKYYALTDTINSKFIGVSKEVRALIDQISSAEKLVNIMPQVVTKYETLAKELGIDVNNIQELKSMKLAIKDISQYKTLASKLKSL